MAEEEFKNVITDLDVQLEQLFKKYNIGRLIELQSMTCIDYEACINVFSEIIETAAESTSAAGTLSPIVITNAERWFSILISVSSQSYFLTPMEKHELAEMMACEALLLFFYALESPTYISKLKALATLFYKDTPSRAAAALVCDLFRKPDDTPDSWFKRVRRIYHLLIRSAALATLVKYRPEALEV